MENDRRCDVAQIPMQMDEVLNEAQRKALPGVLYSGWEPCFMRKRMFLEPEIVMLNRNDNRFCIFEYDGTIRLQGGIKVREEDNLVDSAMPVEPPVWTK
jgi:hypothetical protein